MLCFLTSRTDLPETGGLNPANGFVERLRACLPVPCRALFICSDPEGWEKTDYYAPLVRRSFESAGFSFQRFAVLDGRNEAKAAELVAGSDLLILAGGHVPTQNRFFRRIALRELLRAFDGVLIGISAGSMNCAETVYAQPELEGEALDAAYERFLPGLGLTKASILPHYQDLRDEVLDGLRVMEDLAYPDSMGRSFLVLPDGSYLLVEKGKETVFGPSWLLADGSMTPLSGDGTSAVLRMRLDQVKLRELQPSQFYISEKKLREVEAWLDPAELSRFEPIPVKLLDGLPVMTDGHTRAVAALRAGLEAVPLVWDEDDMDWDMYRACVAACRERGIFSPEALPDRILPAADYAEKWDAWCDRMQAEVCRAREVRQAERSFWDRAWKAPDPRRLAEAAAGPDPEGELLVACLKARGAQRVCDAGCGCGRRSLLLAANGFALSGFDLSGEAVALTKSLLAEQGFPAGDFRRADLLASGFADGAFDAVVCRDVLDHLPLREARAALEELLRILRPGGCLLLTLDETDEDYEAQPHTLSPDGDYEYTDGKWKGMVFHPYPPEELEKLTGGRHALLSSSEKGSVLLLEKPG